MSKKNIALEIIKKLFYEAKTNPEKSDRYVEIARKTGMRVNVPIPRELKRKYCKHCNKYFHDGNYRVRTRNQMVVYYCLNCKKYSKFPIGKRFK